VGVTRRKHRSRSRYFSHKAVTVQGGYGTCFCNPGTNFIKHYACRGTSLIGAGKLSRYWIFVRGTGPAEAGVQVVSEPETCQGVGFILHACARVRMQDVKRIYIASRARNDDKRSKEKRAFGPINYLWFLLGWRLRHQAKTVTNNLPILSVL
jgi:hypothetical protein